MATFVLVHGAWHGGWVWTFAGRALRALGHEVSAPTLTGLGERSHLFRPDIDLGTHVDDVVAHLEMEDLRGVHLVGWSYGGMVIAGALAAATDRIAAMIYLDAFLPDDGETVLDQQPADRRDYYLQYIEKNEPIPPPSVTAFGVSDPAMIAFAEARLRAQPHRTYATPVRALAHRPRDIRHTYIRATGFDPSPFKAVVETRVRADPAIDYREIPVGHDAMLIAPDALASLLDDIVGR